MKRIMVSLVSVAFALLPFSTASAYSHANRYGGSTSHTEGSTSHSSAYGTSSSHTAGEGSSHTNEYGGSTSHSEYGGTSHTNTYGGTTSGEAGYGATHTYTDGATAYHPPADEYHPPAAVLSVSSAHHRGLLRSRVLQLRFDRGRRCGRRCGRRGYRCSYSFLRGRLAECCRLAERLCSGLQRRRIQYRECRGRECQCGSRQRQCRSCQRERSRRGRCFQHRVHDGLGPWGVACWLHHSQRIRRNVLLVREYLVSAGLRREWRVLQGGTHSVAVGVVVALERSNRLVGGPPRGEPVRYREDTEFEHESHHHQHGRVRVCFCRGPARRAMPLLLT